MIIQSEFHLIEDCPALPQDQKIKKSTQISEEEEKEEEGKKEGYEEEEDKGPQEVVIKVRINEKVKKRGMDEKVKK